MTTQATVTPDKVVDPAIQAAADKAAAEKAAAEKVAGEKLILGKFKDQAALETAYKELETKLGAATKPAPTAPVDAQDAATKAGLDMVALSKEYADNNGSLTEDSLKKLEATGITREQVNQHIQGLKASADQFRAGLSELVGGEDTLKLVYDWASVNMTPQELNSYNAIVAKNDLLAAKLVLAGIATKYADAVGKEPKLLNGESFVGAGVEPFESNAQIVAAMSNPQYKNDPAYRRKVEQRMAVTRAFGL